MLPNLFDLYVIKRVLEARSCLFLNEPRIVTPQLERRISVISVSFDYLIPLNDNLWHRKKTFVWPFNSNPDSQINLFVDINYFLGHGLNCTLFKFSTLKCASILWRWWKNVNSFQDISLFFQSLQIFFKQIISPENPRLISPFSAAFLCFPGDLDSAFLLPTAIGGFIHRQERPRISTKASEEKRRPGKEISVLSQTFKYQDTSSLLLKKISIFSGPEAYFSRFFTLKSKHWWKKGPNMQWKDFNAISIFGLSRRSRPGKVSFLWCVCVCGLCTFLGLFSARKKSASTSVIERRGLLWYWSK